MSDVIDDRIKGLTSTEARCISGLESSFRYYSEDALIKIIFPAIHADLFSLTGAFIDLGLAPVLVHPSGLDSDAEMYSSSAHDLSSTDGFKQFYLPYYLPKKVAEVVGGSPQTILEWSRIGERFIRSKGFPVGEHVVDGHGRLTDAMIKAQKIQAKKNSLLISLPALMCYVSTAYKVSARPKDVLQMHAFKCVLEEHAFLVRSLNDKINQMGLKVPPREQKVGKPAFSVRPIEKVISPDGNPQIVDVDASSVLRDEHNLFTAFIAEPDQSSAVVEKSDSVPDANGDIFSLEAIQAMGKSYSRKHGPQYVNHTVQGVSSSVMNAPLSYAGEENDAPLYMEVFSRTLRASLGLQEDTTFKVPITDSIHLHIPESVDPDSAFQTVRDALNPSQNLETPPEDQDVIEKAPLPEPEVSRRGIKEIEADILRAMRSNSASKRNLAELREKLSLLTTLEYRLRDEVRESEFQINDLLLEHSVYLTSGEPDALEVLSAHKGASVDSL